MAIKKHRFELMFKLFCLAATLVFLLWRCRYGVADKDECFVVTMSYRMVLGAAPLVDEWSLAQFVTFLTYPFVWIFVRWNGSTDGIVMAMRHLYVGIIMALALFQYFSWRKFNDKGAFCGAILFALWAPYSMMTLSYLTLDVFMLSIVVTLYCCYRHRPILMFIIGLALASCVLCCPFMVVAYLIYSVIVFRNRVLRNEWLFITLGCAVVATYVMAFILSRASVSDIVASVPGMLSICSDTNHSPFCGDSSVLNYLKSMFGQQKLISLILYFVMAILALWIFVVRKKRSLEALIIKVCWAMFVIFIVIIYIGSWVTPRWAQPDYLLFPLGISTLLIPAVFDDLEMRKIIKWAIAPALLMGFLTAVSSNQGIVRVASVMASVVVPACVLHGMVFGKLMDIGGRKYGFYLKMSYLMIFLVAMASLSARRCLCSHGNGTIFEMDAEITQGAQEGIIVRQSDALKYSELSSIIKEHIAKQEVDYVLFMHKNVLGFLMAQKKFGTYTCWTSDWGLRGFDEYFAMHPDCIPNVVVLAVPKVYAEFSDFDPAPYFIRRGYCLVDETKHYKVLKMGRGEINE